MLLIIGNGFDINLGLRTSYGDYMAFLGNVGITVNQNVVNPAFQTNAKFVKTDLYAYLQKQKENKRWIDIENELKAYSKNLISAAEDVVEQEFKESSWIEKYKKEKQSLRIKEEINKSSKKFEEEFNILTESVKEFITASLANKISTSSHAYIYFKKLVEFLLNSYVLSARDVFILSVLNFNYTNDYTVKEFLNIEFDKQRQKNKNRVNDMMRIETFEKISRCSEVHGNIANNIIIGIEGKSELPKDFNFLKKGLQYNYSEGINVERMLSDNDTIHIYGLSLGETDSPYFRNFFGSFSKPENPLTPSSHIKPKNIIIFHYGKRGYEEIIAMIDILTDKNVDRLRQQNKIKFVDLENYNEIKDIDNSYYFPFDTI